MITLRYLMLAHRAQPWWKCGGSGNGLYGAERRIKHINGKIRTMATGKNESHILLESGGQFADSGEDKETGTDADAFVTELITLRCATSGCEVRLEACALHSIEEGFARHFS